jgi:beta-lactamase class A
MAGQGQPELKSALETHQANHNVLKAGDDEMNWNRVITAVQAAEKHGTAGVSILGPDGSRWSNHGGRKFRAASTVKIPLMVEIFRQVDRGERSLDDLHTLTAADKAPGSGVLLHLHDGIEVTLNDLVYLTISISDNTATNILIRYATMDAVNAVIAEMGMTGSNLGREMKGRPAQAGETENWATPDDYVTVVQAILSNSAASPASCASMLAMLEKQQNSRRIARFLPVDDSVRWGTKTGSISGVTNDAGFVTTSAGTLVIAVFCEGMPDHHIAEEAIGEITRAALLDCDMLPG